MPEEIKKTEPVPKYKLSRKEILDAVEAITGKKPKANAKQVVMTMHASGDYGFLTWVDAAGEETKAVKKRETNTTSS